MKHFTLRKMIMGGLLCLGMSASAQSLCDSVTAEFTYQVQGLDVTFQSVNTYPNMQFYWAFGDNAFATGPSADHTYAQDGQFFVCATVVVIDSVNQDTCVNNFCQLISVGTGFNCGMYEASFFFVTQVPNLVFVATNYPALPAGYSLEQAWDFGDGATNVGNASFLDHTYAAPGTYNVCLAVTVLDSLLQVLCTDSICQDVTVGSGSICDNVSAVFADSVSGFDVEFQSTWTEPQAQYSWDFGDGNTGAGPSPAHTYAGPGVYQVCCIVTAIDTVTQDTCSADFCQLVTISGPVDCQLYQADFAWVVNGPFDLAFSTSYPAPPAGYSIDYSWTFGDGNSVSGLSSTANTYASAGAYEVCVEVVVSDSLQQVVCSSLLCDSVLVPGGICDNIDATFTAFVSGTTANFQNVWINAAADYSWDFGDGTTGTGPNPAHAYANDSTFQVCLIVTAYDSLTQDTCSVDYCTLVEVDSSVIPCDSLINASFSAVEDVPGTWVFTNGTASNNADSTSYAWDFGDGATSTLADPTYTYLASGIYQVCLTATLVENGDTCVSTYCDSLSTIVLGLDAATAMTSGITAWPVPFERELMLQGADLTGDVQVTLFDAMGRRVLARRTSANGVLTLTDLDLASGTYTLSVLTIQGAGKVRVVRR